MPANLGSRPIYSRQRNRLREKKKEEEIKVLGSCVRIVLQISVKFSDTPRARQLPPASTGEAGMIPKVQMVVLSQPNESPSLIKSDSLPNRRLIPSEISDSKINTKSTVKRKEDEKCQ